MPNADLERFYELLAHLGSLPGQGRPLSEYSGDSAWPERGVYFFFEPGEFRAFMPDRLRVVRVGTHGLREGEQSTLWSRLHAHRGGLDGGGNNRGSVFRRHVGAALIRRDGSFGEDLSTWGRGQSSSREVRLREAAHERRVSVYLGNLPVSWVEVPDAAGPQSQRCVIERNAIALLSNGMVPEDPPSPTWLGLHAARAEVRGSGLWNVAHVLDRYEPAFLDGLEELVRRMV